jgi:hypothetical protein
MQSFLKIFCTFQIFYHTVSISKTVIILDLAGKLKRKPSGGERAWFLEEESEPRNKLVFLAGENQRADVSASLTVTISRFWRCFVSHSRSFS